MPTRICNIKSDICENILLYSLSLKIKYKARGKLYIVKINDVIPAKRKHTGNTE